MHVTNHLISNLISKINYGVQKRLRFLNIERNKTTLEILKILYKNGAIRSYRIINENCVSIYFKYYLCNKAIKISQISTPGNRIFWKIEKLTKNYNKNNFSGFYIISTSNGILNSNLCLLENNIGGEVQFKIEI